MVYGWAGRILRVDLSKKKIIKQPTADYSREVIAGRGINAKIAYDEIPVGISAFDPENILMFGVGPLTGTSAPSASRTETAAKSPVTNLFGQSNFGGHWGAELKFSGYDHIVIHGKAERPSYLYIYNDDVEIRDASHLWGLTAFQAQHELWKELGPETKVVCIGPGGENLVVFASLIHELGDGAGRTGMGAVMGSKKLKAITVHGTKPVKVAKPKEYLDACLECWKKVEENPWFEEESTIASNQDHYWEVNFMIGANRTMTYEDEPSPKLKTQHPLLEKYKVANRGCYNCPISCMSFIRMPSGTCLMSCQGFTELGPEIMNPDPTTLGEAFRKCENYGLDLLETGHAIAMLCDMYEHNIISKDDTDGMELKWGDTDMILTMIEKIARREGFCNMIGDGIVKFAKEVNGEDYAMATKGMGNFCFNYYAYKGIALGMSVATGGRAIRCMPRFEWISSFWEDIPEDHKSKFVEDAVKATGTEESVKVTAYEGKAASVNYTDLEHIVCDMMGVCKWASVWFDQALGSSDYTRLFNLCTGVEITQPEMLKIADRVRCIERAFEVREGLTREWEKPPKRYFERTIGGRYRGEKLDRAKFEQMKDEYYRLKGWDVETGIPTEAKLKELGLEYVAEDLKKLGKIK